MLIPLRPIPFYSKRYCQTHGLAYQSEQERVVAYLRTLDLEDEGVAKVLMCYPL